MKIKAIAFDVGGVLVQKVFASILSELVTKYNLDATTLNEYAWPLFDKVNRNEMTERELFESIIKQFSIPVDVSVLEKRSMKLESITEVWEYLKVLKGKYKLAILSNMGEKWSQAREEQFHLSDWFDEIVWSCDLGISKPDKRIFDYLTNKLSINPEECVFIDDKPKNIEAAKSYGFQGIVYQNPQQLEQDLASLGVDVKSGI